MVELINAAELQRSTACVPGSMGQTSQMERVREKLHVSVIGYLIKEVNRKSYEINAKYMKVLKSYQSRLLNLRCRINL